MEINNLIQLMPSIQIALDNTTKILLNKLQEIITNRIYGVEESDWYERTGEFLDSWESITYKFQKQIVESEIWQEYAEMIWNPEKYQHGNRSRRLEDGELAEMLNSGMNKSMDVSFVDRQGAKFWDEFEIYVNANLNRIFAMECNKLGLNVSVGLSRG